MYKELVEIPNSGDHCYIAEVSFRPDGKVFAATFGQKNEVHLYDARSLQVIRVLRNPNAMLDGPHGIWLTSRHMIVTNKGTVPSRFSVFRLDDESGVPVQTYTAPYAHLHEGHSIALHGRRLVVTYCEGPSKKGALVCYDYDDESGRINGPTDIQEQWFRRYGDTKGVCFDEKGENVYVTFESEPLHLSKPRQSLSRLVKNTISFGSAGGTWRNGIAVFGVDERGHFTTKPRWKKLFGKSSRLENIHIRGGLAVVTNPIGRCVYVYDLGSSRPFESPAHVLSEDLVFPHGAKMSPDGAKLVVTDDGIEVIDGVIHWGSFVSPRKDRLVVFDLVPA